MKNLEEKIKELGFSSEESYNKYVAEKNEFFSKENTTDWVYNQNAKVYRYNQDSKEYPSQVYLE